MAKDGNRLSDIRIKLERAEKHLHEALSALVRSIYPARRWSARDGRISCCENCIDGLEIVKSLAWIATCPSECFSLCRMN